MRVNGFFGVFIAWALFSCSDQDKVARLSFIPTFAKQLVSCPSPLKIGNDVWKIKQLQLYISDVELQDDNGVWTTWQMKITPLQNDNVALVGEHCSESSSGDWQVEFSQPIDIKQYENIRFSLGVPFDKNHLNPLRQQSPLNYSSMFWVWQTGHKFLRLEMSSENSNWLFHLGSTGCSAASALRSPSKPCLYPNLVKVKVKVNIPVAQALDITLDLSKLFQDITLSEQTMCQSGHNNKTCQQLFKNLGQVKGAQQTVFTINDQ